MLVICTTKVSKFYCCALKLNRFHLTKKDRTDSFTPVYVPMRKRVSLCQSLLYWAQ